MCAGRLSLREDLSYAEWLTLGRRRGAKLSVCILTHDRSLATLRAEEVSRMRPIGVGIDLGGTKCASGAVDLRDGQVLWCQEMPTHVAQGSDQVFARLVALAQDHLARARALGGHVASLGVGVPELVSPDGRLQSAATLDWQHRDLRDDLGRLLHLPVEIDADVRAAARAEATYGAGRDCPVFLYVTIGTGISACLVLDGKPFLGTRGLTGTFASSRVTIPTDQGTLIDGPALEDFASGKAIATRFARDAESRLADAAQAGNARLVFDAADQGDARAAEIIATAGQAVGAALAQLVNLLDPQIIVLGGGLGVTAGRYRLALESAYRRHVWAPPHQAIPLVSAALGRNAGWIGAALVDTHRHSRSSP